MKKLLVNKYLSEIDWIKELNEGTENLIVANTGSGKSLTFIKDLSQKKNIAITSPFVSLNHQFMELNPNLSIEVGLKTKTNSILSNNGVIVSFHSIPRLLEIQQPLDFLIVDELHYLISYAGFSAQIINPFWETIDKLKEKFPKMIIVYLTATPQFLLPFAKYKNWNIAYVDQLELTSKPSEVIISKNLAKHLSKNETSLVLYPSKTQGMKWAAKYKGSFISSEVKGQSEDFETLIKGKMPNQKVFTSTVLSTGLSIHDPVDTVYTSWAGSLVDVVQMSARPRLGGHTLFIQQITNPWFAKYMDLTERPAVNFEADYRTIFEQLSHLSQWTSIMANKEEQLLYEIIQDMLYNPLKEIIIPDYIIHEYGFNFCQESCYDADENMIQF
jgi:hypothetical protein